MKPKIIAIAMQKGGTGKSTIAANLAVAADQKTALFDLDPQESTAIWGEKRQNELPHVEFLTDVNFPKPSRRQSAMALNSSLSTLRLQPARKRIRLQRRPT